MPLSKETEAEASTPPSPPCANGSDSDTTFTALEATTEAAPGDQATADDAPADEMPPGGRPRNAPPRRDADLTSLLVHADKVEITALITTLTDSMLQRIIRLFDPSTGDSNAPTPRIDFWSQLPTHLKDLSLNDPDAARLQSSRTSLLDNMKPTRSKKAGRARDKRGSVHPQNADTSSQAGVATTAAAAGAATTEPSAPRLQELKKEALLHFKKWQASVHRRISEIMVWRPFDNSFAPTGPGQKRRQSANRRGRGSGRAQYSNWATPPTPNPVPAPSFPMTSSITLPTDPLLTMLFPPVPTPIASWPTEKKCLLFHALFLLMLSIENYSPYSRVLLLNVASALGLPLHVLTDDEDRVGNALAQIAKDIPAEILGPKKTEDGKSVRKWKGHSGTSPALVAKMTAILEGCRIGSVFGIRGIPPKAAIGLLGIFGENSYATAALFGMCGVRNSNRLMEHYLKEVNDLAFVPLRGALEGQVEIGKIDHDSRKLRIVLGIGGWLMNSDDPVSPWHCLGPQNEVYAVRWELDALSKLGASFDTLVRSAAWSAAKKEIVARTSKLFHGGSPSGASAMAANQFSPPVFTNLAERRWPAGLTKISKIVDNNWNNGMVRADKLGAVLADMLISKAQGERGVSLVGYSLGARAIYTCLMLLAEKRAFGLVENAVLIGTPAPSEPLAWCAMKSVVGGRLVNVYSENDYILGFLYRMGSIDFGLAGLQRVVGVAGVENVDVTAKVSVHMRYQYLVGSILQHIGWEDMVPEQIARHEADMSGYEDRNRKHEERRNAIEMGSWEVAKRENEQGVIRTRMRKKGKK
ncbi:hypothetical protein VTJ04DRAFT_9127 [Mycothermus thermophilus]|uniref:uncharacterized protein n=1 Tax=Humicola insolens TaxID=85995 RepID=UPI00374480C6